MPWNTDTNIRLNTLLAGFDFSGDRCRQQVQEKKAMMNYE
jgi:hypothetical protein